MYHPQVSEREKEVIRVFVETRANLSYSSIASILNNAFPEDNDGRRSGNGVYKVINTFKQEIKNQRRS